MQHSNKESSKNQQKVNRQSKQNKPLISTQFTGEWEWLPTINEDEGPSPRCGHTLTVHGKQLDHLTAIKERRERNYKPTVDRNEDRKSTLGTKRGKLLVAFGESSLLSSREYLDDIYLLDIATLKWAKILGRDVMDQYKPYIKANFNPVARADHAAVSFGDNEDRCLFFGGKCKDTYLDDVIHIKNICNFPINEIEQEIYENSYNNRSRFGNNKYPNMPRPFYTDNPLKIDAIHLPKGPCGRRGSSLAPWKEGSFLLFGGQRGSIFFNDLWGLDLYKQGWVELATRKNPMERAFHSAFVDSQQQMLLLGGVRDTQANPAPADIFKLDLREGKFFKLGDKDMVPGIAGALSKGHHSSHFLSQNCDLVIFSPQKATTHVLGGNVQSEHCGKCSQINVFTKDTEIKPLNNNNNSNNRRRSRNNRHENDNNYPSGTCRPATALLESHTTINEMKSIGCNKNALERLFVFGGYNPSIRQCTNKLFSLKFSAEACKIKDHKCQFTPTPNIPAALQMRQQYIIKKEQEEQQQQQHEQGQNNNNNNNHIESDMNENDNDNANDTKYNKFNNDRLCNVTPMRVTRRSRLSNIRNTNQKVMKTNTEQNDENLQNNNNINNNEIKKESQQQNLNKSLAYTSPYLSSANSCSEININGTGSRKVKRKKAKRVSIIQTPVRAKPITPSNMNSFRNMHQSSHANQKINGLDPELLGKKHQRYDQQNNNQNGQQNNNNNNNPNNPFGSEVPALHHSASQDQLTQNNNNNNRHDIKSTHWQYIERILLNFDESLLDPETAFILEPHEVIEIIHTALPLLENDPTLIRIDGPVKVFGDIHGQLGDLMSLFKSFGYPDTNIGDIAYYKYVFLGDFVDRGHKCLEVMCLLLALKIEYPDRIFLIRGNHECHAMNEMYGFYHEINDRLYPNIDTLKFLENDVLNENINLTECDRELSAYYQKEEARNQKRDQLNQQKLYQLQQEGRIDEFHALQNKINIENEIFNFELEFEMIPIDGYDDDASEYLSDDISAELNFDSYDNESDQISYKPKTRKTHKKKYKSRKYFRDRTDCITYLIQSFELTFRWLPLSILISDKILCVHGGIGQITTIEQIANISRPCDVVCDVQQEMDDEERKVVDLLWSDPAEKDTDTGFQPNKRGVSCVFGSDVVRNFCTTNNIDLIIRGHQVVKDGFEYFAGGHLITLFSATNYCNVMDNAGAILCIDEKLRVLPKLVEPRPIHQYNSQNINDDDDDDDDESADNLQWKKLKQFPPSPMRNSGDHNEENNNPRHSIIDDDDTDDDELLNIDSNNKINLQFEMEQNNGYDPTQTQDNNHNQQYFNPPN